MKARDFVDATRALVRWIPVALRERADELRAEVYTQRATLLDQGYTPDQVNRLAYNSDLVLAWADLLDALSRGWSR